MSNHPHPPHHYTYFTHVHRCSTAMLFMILSHLDRKKRGRYTALLILDIASHWAHISHTDRSSPSGGHHHHKDASILRNKNFILREYYASFPLFAFCCIGNEAFLLLEYAKHFVNDKGPWRTAIEVSKRERAKAALAGDEYKKGRDKGRTV